MQLQIFINAKRRLGKMFKKRWKSLIALALMFSVDGTALMAAQTVVLNSTQGNAVILAREIDQTIPAVPPGSRACIAVNGTQADVLQEVVSPDSSMAWLQVTVTTGNCTGVTGWVTSNDVQRQ